MSVNRVILVGNVGADPEYRVTQTGSGMASFSLATSETWKDKISGQKQEKTEWHRVVFFNRQAEVVRDYVHKGSQLYVEGKLQTRKWEADGVKQSITEVVCDRLEFVGGPKNPETTSQVFGEKAVSRPASAQQSAPQPMSKPAPPPSYTQDFDDVPF
jgi:single-strand DNA-binding protein